MESLVEKLFLKRYSTYLTRSNVGTHLQFSFFKHRFSVVETSSIKNISMIGVEPLNVIKDLHLFSSVLNVQSGTLETST